MDSMNGFEIEGRRISVEPAQGKGEGRSSRVEDSAVEEITHAVAVVPEAVIRVAVAIKANATVVSAAAQPTDATTKTVET